MAEPIVSTYQHSQPGPSRKVIYSRIERSTSPKSERYRIKQLLLQEKFDAIEAQTDALRKRVQIVKKEVQRAMEVRKALCNLLDEKGDHWYKGCIEMDMSDKYDIDPLHDFAHLLRREEPGGRKRSRPSAKSKPKAVKAKEQPMTTEQKQEEERAKAKIVSIIDSVFSETAKKTAKSEQLINNKYSMKNAASRNTQTSAQVARHTSGSRSNKSSGGVTKASQPRIKNNVLHAKKALPYKIFSNKNQRKTIPADTVNGIHEGIKFTFIPRPNGVSKKKAEKKMATSHPTIQAKTPLVHDTPPVEPKTADIVDKRTENTAESKEMVPETDNSVKPVETEAADHAKNSEVTSDSKESSVLPLELANTAVEAPPTISAATVESS